MGKHPVHTAGIANLLDHPEYQSLEKAQPLMSFLSDAEFDALPAKPGDLGTNIVIGPENVNEALKDSSVIMASYDLGDGMKGLIGVVGPTRMDYAAVAARLTGFAEGLTRLFGKELPPKEEPKK